MRDAAVIGVFVLLVVLAGFVASRPRVVEFDGHKFIMYGSRAMVHHPDCGCGGESK